MIFIYDENLQIIARPLSPTYEDFVLEPNKFYPYFDANKHIYNSEQFLYAILDNGILRNLNQGEYVESNQIKFKACPNGLYKALWVTPNWIEGATLEEVQEFKRVELKNARDTEILSYYLYTNNHIYDADLDSRNRLFQAQQLGVGVETNINWITADNQVSSVSNADLVNIVNGIAHKEQLAFNKFASKYTEVLNCTNIDDVKNIKY